MKYKKFLTYSLIVLMVFVIFSSSNTSGTNNVKGFATGSCTKTYYSNTYNFQYSTSCGSDWNGHYIVVFFNDITVSPITVKWGDITYLGASSNTKFSGPHIISGNTIHKEFSTDRVIAGFVDNYGHSSDSDTLDVHRFSDGINTFTKNLGSSVRYNYNAWYYKIVFEYSMNVGFYDAGGGGVCGPSYCPE